MKSKFLPAGTGLAQFGELAHAIGDGTVAAYQRSDLFDKQRNLMADWAKYINTAPVVGDNVVPMHRAA